MIKGGFYLKLFVLSLFTLLISCFTFGVNFSDSAYVRQIGYYGYNPYSQSVNINITSAGGFLSETAGYTKALFVLKDNSFDKSYFWWTNTGVPYYYGHFRILGSSNYYSNTKEGYLKKYFTCSEIIPESNSIPGNCVEHEFGDSYSVMANFLSNVNSSDYFAFDSSVSHAYNSNIGLRNDILCISSSRLGSSLCFRAGVYVGNQNSLPNNTYQVYVGNFNGANFNLGANLDWLSIDSNLLKNPPSVYNTSNNGESDSSSTDEITTNDIISYYENQSVYNFSQEVCHVNTWNLDSYDYDDFKTARNGYGYPIFNFFRYAYNIGSGYYTLTDVGGFIDELYFNYGIYYNDLNRDYNGNIVNIYKYDLNSHLLNPLYTGYSNPFTGKPLVYEVYPQYLHYLLDYYERYTGKEIATYCYYKLGFANHSSNNGGSSSITGYDNIFGPGGVCQGSDCYVNNDNYSDAGNLVGDISNNEKTRYSDYKFVDKNYQWSISGNYVSVSESWNGTIINYFNDNTLTGGFNEKDFFKSSFNRFKGLFSDITPGDLGFGFLPGYIITFLLAIIIFRFLSH